MNDVNDALTESNQQDGSGFESISSSFTGGGGVRLWANDRWRFGASFERLLASSEDAAQPGDELKADANAFQIDAAYFWPERAGLRLGVGAGLALVSLDGELVSAANGRQPLEGFAPGFAAFGAAEYRVARMASVVASAGYRMADVGIDASTNGSTVDFSGFASRLGVAIDFPVGR